MAFVYFPNTKCRKSYQYNNYIQDVPDAFEVLKLVNTQLQDLFYNVVEDKDTEDYLTSNNEEIPSADIPEELYGSDLPGWDGTTSGREFYHQPG